MAALLALAQAVRDSDDAFSCDFGQDVIQNSTFFPYSIGRLCYNIGLQTASMYVPAILPWSLLIVLGHAAHWAMYMDR